MDEFLIVILFMAIAFFMGVAAEDVASTKDQTEAIAVAVCQTRADERGFQSSFYQVEGNQCWGEYTDEGRRPIRLKIMPLNALDNAQDIYFYQLGMTSETPLE